MNLRDLEYLVAVADLRSFSQAAEQCGVSQPTLSGQIKKLEDGLGVALFERTNKRVMPTDVGVRIILSARKILREADNIADIATASVDPFGGRFRLGAFPTLSTYVFPRLVPLVKEHMPNLKLILIEEKTEVLLDKLRQGLIDVALLATPVHDSFLVSQALFDDAFFLAVPPDHSLSRSECVDPSTLAHQRLLLLEEGHCMREHALEVCQLYSVNEEHDFRATGLETLRQMVKAGTGITLMPEIAIDRSDSGICYIPFAGEPPRRTISLLWRKTSSREQIISKLASMLTTG